MHWLTEITQCSATQWREFIRITLSYAVPMLRTNYFTLEHRKRGKFEGFLYLIKGTEY